MDVGTARPVVGRISLTGELGYEIVVPRRSPTLLARAARGGRPAGLRLIGDRAIDSLRLEKGYGIWSAEFTQEYTPAMAGLDRFFDLAKGSSWVASAARAREAPAQRLVLLEVDATEADASADEGVWIGDRRAAS